MSAHQNDNGYHVGKRGLCVKLRGDNINSALSQLKRLMEEEGLIKKFRTMGYYTSPGKKRRQKAAEGRARYLRECAKRMDELGY